jgi:hypothetical protein
LYSAQGIIAHPHSVAVIQHFRENHFQGEGMAISVMGTSEAPAKSKKMLWTGRVLSALPVLAMGLSAAMKFSGSEQVIQGFAKFGYTEHQMVPLGILELTCVIIYLVPQTAVLGGILMAAYLGGATATVYRVGDPSFFLPALLGVVAWLGLYLREPRLRALTPLRK